MEPVINSGCTGEKNKMWLGRVYQGTLGEWRLSRIVFFACLLISHFPQLEGGCMRAETWSVLVLFTTLPEGWEHHRLSIHFYSVLKLMDMRVQVKLEITGV